MTYTHLVTCWYWNLCTATCVLYETFQTQFHNIFTGIEVRGRSLMTEFTDLTTVWRLHPSLLFTSSPPPPSSPSPLPRDGITPHLPTLMRYPLNLLSSNQAFSSPCLQLSTLTRKAVMLAWRGFWFVYIAWVWHNYVSFFWKRVWFLLFFVCFCFVYIYICSSVVINK